MLSDQYTKHSLPKAAVFLHAVFVDQKYAKTALIRKGLHIPELRLS